jgi:hypothetical protein
VPGREDGSVHRDCRRPAVERTPSALEDPPRAGDGQRTGVVISRCGTVAAPGQILDCSYWASGKACPPI